MRATRIITILLVLSFGISSVVPNVLFTKKKGSTMAGFRITIVLLENTCLLFSTPPVSPDSQYPDAEEDLTEDDKNSCDPASLDFVISENPEPIYLLNNSLLTGAVDAPFSPPDYRIS